MDMEKAHQHILSIRSDCEVGSQRLKRAMEGALLTIEKGFSGEGHYLYEFIQNADDENSKTVRVLLEPNQVTILNDGDPFEYDDVDALCDVAHSHKSPGKYIGYLGVGFKSVFLISDGPEVHSGSYHFAFRKPQNENDFPGKLHRNGWKKLKWLYLGKVNSLFHSRGNGWPRSSVRR